MKPLPAAASAPIGGTFMDSYLELPGCSLCGGNQPQIRKGSPAISTSTRNFPDRLGLDTQVFLGSAELSAVSALLGRIPTMPGYLGQMNLVGRNSGDIYRYMTFDQIADFREVADTVQV